MVLLGGGGHQVQGQKGHSGIKMQNWWGSLDIRWWGPSSESAKRSQWNKNGGRPQVYAQKSHSGIKSSRIKTGVGDHQTLGGGALQCKHKKVTVE